MNEKNQSLMEAHQIAREAARLYVRLTLEHLARMADQEIKYGSKAWVSVVPVIDSALAKLEIL